MEQNLEIPLKYRKISYFCRRIQQMNVFLLKRYYSSRLLVSNLSNFVENNWNRLDELLRQKFCQEWICKFRVFDLWTIELIVPVYSWTILLTDKVVIWCQISITFPRIMKNCENFRIRLNHFFLTVFFPGFTRNLSIKHYLPVY